MASDAFEAVYKRLKGLLQPYAGRLHVSFDGPLAYGLDMASEAERDPTTWFAGVRSGKRYVSYYLMPVYVKPSLLDGISPELRRRMQGKSCFNFTDVNEGLLRELETLTKRGYDATDGDPRWGAARRAERQKGRLHRGNED